jgi:hypothetical protein
MLKYFMSKSTNSTSDFSNSVDKLRAATDHRTHRRRQSFAESAGDRIRFSPELPRWNAKTSAVEAAYSAEADLAMEAGNFSHTF